MVKKYGLWYVVKYYNILLYLAYWILLIATYPFITEYVINILGKSVDKTADITIRFCIAGVLVYAGLYPFINSCQSKTYKYLTGRNLGHDKSLYKRAYYDLLRYFKDADPYKMCTDSYTTIPWEESEGVILGKTKDGKLINIRSGKNGYNYFVFGVPGIGKTAGPIICSCLRFGMDHPLSEDNKESFGSVFCIDVKGDIYSITHKYRKIKCFDLINPDKSCHYNPFEGIEKMSIDERCNFIESIGFTLITNDGGDNYFSDTARDYWNGIALYMLHEDINTSFPEVIEAILLGNAIDWVKKVINGDCKEAKYRLQNKYGENEKNLSGGYSCLAKSARKFSSNVLIKLLGNDPKYEYISVQMIENGYDCYIEIDQAEIDNYVALLSMIVQGFLKGFMQRERNPKVGRLKDGTLRPCLMALDEFAQLKNLSYSETSTAFMTLRSRNVNLLCAMQSISSLAEMFKSDNAAQSIIDCVTTFAFLAIQEVETREWASKLIGNQKVLKIENSLSKGSNGKETSGKSVVEATEPIIQPADFGNFVDKDAGKDKLLIYSGGKYIIADKVYYFN